MKKLALLVAIFIVLFSFSSCATNGHSYDEGYDDGYDIGYNKGIADAQDWIASRVDTDLWFLANEIEDEYGLHPEDAIRILSNYADVPDEVTDEELHKAIWAIYRYYNREQKVIQGIEDYRID